MKKELLETIDETVENICKWANKEFKSKEITRRDALLHYIDGNDDQKDNCLDRQLRIIDSLSELLQARTSIENNGKEVTNESTD